MTLVDVVWLVAGGLVIGALGRLAVPGPDPMPWWATILLGLAGSFLGGTVGFALGGLSGGLLGSVVAASVLLIGYRRLVQGRPITGPEARRRPPD